MDTVNCKFCGEEILATAQKCKHCNEWLKVECPYCAELIDKDTEKCPHCKSDFELVQQNKSFKNQQKQTETDKDCLINNMPFFIFKAIILIIGVICLFRFGDLGLSIFCVGIIGFYVYFLPTIIADENIHPNTTAIFVVNIFFGVTLIGWVVAMIWAVIKNDRLH